MRTSGRCCNDGVTVKCTTITQQTERKPSLLWWPILLNLKFFNSKSESRRLFTSPKPGHRKKDPRPKDYVKLWIKCRVKYPFYPLRMYVVSHHGRRTFTNYLQWIKIKNILGKYTGMVNVLFSVWGNKLCIPGDMKLGLINRSMEWR